jgi:choline-sulfatase
MNVLFLLSDQHRRSVMGIEGDTVAHTPHLDALAKQSIRFRSAYCSNPVCVPSRASIFTGLYTHSHKTWGNGTPWPFENKTVAHHFSRAGYMTASIGKMHFVDGQTHGFDYRLDFNDWYQALGPRVRQYAEEVNWPASGAGHPQIHNLWDSGDPWKPVLTNDGRKGLVAVGRPSVMAERDHMESFITRESVRFLKDHGQKQPFFLVSGFLKPHDPYMPAERFAGMYDPSKVQLPKTWGKVDLASIPDEMRARIQKHDPTPELSDPDMAKRRIALYYGNVAQVDDSVGKILAALRETGLEDNTIVVYSSDHGEMLGDHGLFQKFVFYEPSAGVPLMVRVPGMAGQGSISSTPVNLVQLVATLTELCGLDVPSGLEGESFVRDLRSPDRTRDTPTYAEFALSSPKGGRYMMRRGKYKYTHYMSDRPELYDLESDPDEMRNLAVLPEFRGVGEDLKAQLLDWVKNTPKTT